MPFPLHARRLAPGTLLAALTLACATASQPAITPTPTNTELPGKFVWHDLVTPDPDGARKFYGAMFGWEFKDAGEKAKHYTVVSLGGRPIGGILDSRGGKAQKAAPQWVSSMSVRDVEAAVGVVKAGGGKVLWGPKTLGPRGPVALVADAEQAAFVLMRAPGGDPPDASPAVNDWLWNEMWTRQPDSAASFYGRLAEYKVTPSDNSSRKYFVLAASGEARAGVAELKAKDVHPTWLAYVRVADLAAAVSRAESLGAKVLIAPSTDIRNGTVALIADPTGAMIALQHWEPKP
jgi:predicted enzyme related to lactoylglutathione lyase